MFLVCSGLPVILMFIFFFKQKTAYEMRISDWSSDVCSSDLHADGRDEGRRVHPSRRPEGAPGHRLDLVDRGEHPVHLDEALTKLAQVEIGRASCRERVCQYV